MTPVKPKVYITKNINNRWYSANVKVINDSLDLKIKTFNEYTILPKYESNGWFKPKTLVVEVINHNPYTETTGLSSYKFERKRKHTGLKIIGIVGGLVGGYLLLK